VAKSKLGKLSGVTCGISNQLGEMSISQSNQAQVVDFACLWIGSTLTELPERVTIWLVEHEYHTWLDIHSSQKIALGLSLGESFHNPPIYSTVALLQSLLHKRVDNLVRNWYSLAPRSSNSLTDRWVLLDHLFEEFLSRYFDKPKLLSKDVGLSSSTRAWWSLDNNLWWSSWGLFAESQLQHAYEICLNSLLLHGGCVDLE